VDTATALASIALAIAAVHALIDWLAHRRASRFDVELIVRPEPVPVALDDSEAEYKLTVVATNRGATHETVERIGLRFVDETADAMGESSVSMELDAKLAPNGNVRWTWDLGEQRYAVGRRYTGWCQLARGKVIESEPDEFDPYSLAIARLVHAVRPEPTAEEIAAAKPG
jgi:hypothetical protein